MTLEFFDHTADVGVRVTTGSLPELFAEAARALTVTLVDPLDAPPELTRRVTLRAPDLDQLLVDWLNELVGLFDIEHFLTSTADVSIREREDEWQLTARVSGQSYDPTRHVLKVLVKGATYHGLHVQRLPAGQWQTSIIFDI